MTPRTNELEVPPLEGDRELYRASLRDDAIDIVAARPLFDDVPPEAAWAMALSDLFHHVVDATVEFAGLERLRTTANLRAKLVAIEREAHVGEITTRPRAEALPEPAESAFEVARARQLPKGRIETRLGGLGWSEERYLQWADLIYDLVHGAAQLESLAPERLMSRVLEEIDQPNTTFRGGRSRISNILPRGDRSCWVSIPRIRDGAREAVRIDLALVSRAPVEDLGIAIELGLPIASSLPRAHEADRLDGLVRTVVAGIKAREALLTARVTRDGMLTLLFYVSDEATATRLASGFPGARVDQVADPSWSRFLALRPDRDELRRLANWDWLDLLADEGRDVDGTADVHHAFWLADASSHDRLVELLSRAGLALASASDDSESGRTECIFEHRLERLAATIDEVTAELEAHALTVGAIYDGWNLGPSPDA